MDTLSIGSLFLEGLLSFFSPCVLPLVPLYIGYLTQDAKVTDEDGNETYKRGRVLYLTIGFMLGISFVFVLAGLGSSALHTFFANYTFAFQLIGGIILILFGLIALHVISVPWLERTHTHTVNVKGMSFFKAVIMGFFFSFAWSPCIGPMLAQAIVKAASADTAAMGWLYIASYAVGFLCIFLLIGFFTTEVLNILKKHRNVVKYTGIISGVIVVAMGAYMLVQAVQTYSAEKSSAAEVTTETTSTAETTADASADASAESTEKDIEKYDFTLKDHDGTEIQLSSYKGKTVIVNFFATWCGYCNKELPGLQKIQENDPDVVILLVAAPNVNNEGDEDYVYEFLTKAGYTMKVVYDPTLTVTNMYSVSGYPTSFIFKPDGDFYGYVPGYVSEDSMLGYIAEAKQ